MFSFSVGNKAGPNGFFWIGFCQPVHPYMCLPSPKFFLWDCVWGGGGKKGGGEEKREGGGRRGKEGVGCVFVIKPLKQVS